MATKSPRIDHPLFQNVEAEINSLFKQLIERVNSRRDQLFSRMYELWNSYEDQIRKKENTIKDVEKMRHRMEIISIEDNVAVEIQRRSVVAFEEQIRSLEETVDPPNLIFSGSLTEELLDQVDKLGELFECGELESHSIKKTSSIDYKNKKKAVLTIGTKGTKRRHFNRPSRIHIDGRTKRLYVPDSENRRVQVMSTTGEFITQFGQEEMQFPVSVATDRKHIYVSDNSQDCILRYKLSDFTFVNSEIGTPGGSQHLLKLPRGIIVSEDGEVMVADNNHRICVFKSGLSFLSEFGRGQLNFPQSIQIKTDKIFVLDSGNPC